VKQLTGTVKRIGREPTTFTVSEDAKHNEILRAAAKAISVQDSSREGLDEAGVVRIRVANKIVFKKRRGYATGQARRHKTERFVNKRGGMGMRPIAIVAYAA
jgi:hypothetical protein